MVAAENAPGVKGVNDHLAWVDADAPAWCSTHRMMRPAQAKAS